MQQKEKDRVIINFIKKVKGRLQIISMWKYMLISVVIGLSAWTLVNVTALIWPIYAAVYYGAAACVLVILAGIVAAVLHFPTKKQAALAADSKGLKERVTTAYELMGKEDIFSRIQKDDTVKAIKGFDIKKSFPFVWRWKWLLAAFMCMIVVLVTAMLDTEAKREAVRIHAVKEKAEEKKEELAEKLEEIMEENELTLEQAEEMKELLEAALKELMKAESELGIEKAEERLLTKLEQKLTESYKEQMQALQNMMNSMENMQQGTLSKEEMEELLKELEEMAGQMSSEELKELAEQMQNELQAGELSQTTMNAAMSQLGQMSNGAQTMLNAGGQQSVQGSQNGQQSGQSGQQGSQGGQNGNSGNGNGAGNGSGNGNGNGAGNGSGTGNGNGSGAGNGTGWNTGSDVGYEKDYDFNGEKVTITDKVASENSNLTGAPNQDGESYQTQGGPTMTWSGVEVEYSQVIAEYTNQAYAGLEQSDIPDSMKDIVKDYFSELNK